MTVLSWFQKSSFYTRSPTRFYLRAATGTPRLRVKTPSVTFLAEPQLLDPPHGVEAFERQRAGTRTHRGQRAARKELRRRAQRESRWNECRHSPANSSLSGIVPSSNATFLPLAGAFFAPPIDSLASSCALPLSGARVAFSVLAVGFGCSACYPPPSTRPFCELTFF